MAASLRHGEEPMRTYVAAALVVLMIAGAGAVASAKSLDQYVEEAGTYRAAGDLEKAAATMEEAIAQYPDSAIVYAYLGLYRGMQAGATDNFMEAGRLSSEAFDLLDKAVEIDPENPRARLYRGLMSVKVPTFMGKLSGGIEDLEAVIDLHAEHPAMVSGEIMTTAYSLLGEGYTKMGEKEKAISAWEMVVSLAPGSPEADQAETAIADLTLQGQEAQNPEEAKRSVDEIEEDLEVTPEDPVKLAELGKAYLDAGEIEKAETTLRKAIALGPEEPHAYTWLAMALGQSMGTELYDERIHKDTDWATNLAFEMVDLLDKAVNLAPGDVETRLFRGIVDVQMPFFTGKLDQGMADLEMVMAGNAADDIKAQAAYWLGYGHQKQATTYWIKVLTDYDDEQAAQMALSAMRPPLQRLDMSEIRKPAVVVDFSLGFRDELPPQTAVWVETPAGKFVRTLYVSGFSGHAREVQIVLPVWAATSKFAGADAVTGASIDNGEHLYVWDLNDESGARVQPGDYVIKVETHFWPSMTYEMASATIAIGGDEPGTVTKEGTYIPFLELRYIP
jgi:tetratricopeptide (TPR) repeat protein